MSEPALSAQIEPPPPAAPALSRLSGSPLLQLVRLGVEKPQPAVAFLHAKSRGVMDLIAHFWERLAHTPPLARQDLHLLVAAPNESYNVNINISEWNPDQLTGAMLYVPKAHRADVLALDRPTAAAFAAYIAHQGAKSGRTDAEGGAGVNASANSAELTAAAASANGSARATTIKEATGRETDGSRANPFTSVPVLSLTDLSAPARSGAAVDVLELPAELPAAKGGLGGKVPIDFLTGQAEGIEWMTPLLLPLVNKRAPARQLVNVVMQLPVERECKPDLNVRLAKDADVPLLNRWRRQYKEERGILFDADMDALVEHQRVFAYEVGGQVVSLAKLDLELKDLVEIGGVYTFPEFRNHGYGAAIVRDLACRIRQAGKVPMLQVDEQNKQALRLYEAAGWQEMGKLARTWLTG